MRLLGGLALILVGIAFERLAGFFPSAFSAAWQAFSLRYAETLARLTGWFSFSLSEFLFYALALAAVFGLAAAVFSSIRYKEAGAVISYFSWAALVAGILIFLYYTLFGAWFSYHSPVMPTLERVNPTKELLYAAAKDMQSKANLLAESVERNAEGEVIMGSFEDMSRTVCAAYAEKIEPLGYTFTGRPKRVLWSEGLSFCGVAGIYLPYTAEANINAAAPALSIPFTMAHELSHRFGTMREDECNYIAFDLLIDEGGSMSYSAAYSGYIFLSNALYSADVSLWAELRKGESARLSADFANDAAYWMDYDGVTRKISNLINDTHIKLDGQPAGARSYGLVADLLISRYVAESE